MVFRISRVLVGILSMLALTACGGGGGGGRDSMPEDMPGPINPPGSTPGDPGPPITNPPALALPLQAAGDEGRTPTLLINDQLHIGGQIDTAEFSSVDSMNRISRSFHNADSGDNSVTLAYQLKLMATGFNSGSRLFYEDSPPTIQLVSDNPVTPQQVDLMVRAVQLLNEALPEDFQLRFDSTPHPVGDLDTLSPSRETSMILVRFAPRDDWVQSASGSAVGVINITRMNMNSGRILNSFIEIDQSRASSNLSILLHYLVQGLGLGVLSPNARTITSGNMRSIPGFILYERDVDFLQAVYGGRLERERSYAIPFTLFRNVLDDLNTNPGDIGPWSRAGTYFLGRFFPVGGGTVEFGARLRNGHVRAFARGPRPGTDFIENPMSLGATYSGILTGFTHSGRPLEGSMNLSIDMTPQQGNAVGNLRFRDLRTFAPGGLAGSPIDYAGGRLDYQVEVTGNTFRERTRPAGTEDRVTGAFFNQEHSAMGGVLERNDATAGFGGERRR